MIIKKIKHFLKKDWLISIGGVVEILTWISIDNDPNIPHTRERLFILNISNKTYRIYIHYDEITYKNLNISFIYKNKITEQRYHKILVKSK